MEILFVKFFILMIEYIRYLDVNREPIIAHVISMDNEKGKYLLRLP
jgi:hypothetical protein